MTDLSTFRETYRDATRADTFTAILAELDDGLDAYELSDHDVALIVDGIWSRVMDRRPAPKIWREADIRALECRA